MEEGGRERRKGSSARRRTRAEASRRAARRPEVAIDLTETDSRARARTAALLTTQSRGHVTTGVIMGGERSSGITANSSFVLCVMKTVMNIRASNLQHPLFTHNRKRLQSLSNMFSQCGVAH